MSTEEIIKVEAFLKSRRILTMFKREFRLLNKSCSSYMSYMREVDMPLVIAFSFMWKKSARGYFFWMEISGELYIHLLRLE